MSELNVVELLNASNCGLEGNAALLAPQTIEGLEEYATPQNLREIYESSEQRSGYKALGFDGDKCIIYGYKRKQIFAIPPAKLYDAATLRIAVGAEFYDAHSSGVDENGKPMATSPRALGMEIQAECDAIGYYNADAVRGAGVWLDSTGELVVNSSKLFNASGVLDRTHGKHVYEQSVDVGITPFTQAATKEEVGYFLQALATFNWKRKSDALLELGWVGQAYLAGATSWRVHASLTGPRGSGKSTLDGLVHAALGTSYALIVDGATTEAGIRQTLKSDARPLIIDESEADGAHISKHFDMLRSASSGSTVIRGGQGGNATSYNLYCAAQRSGIKSPEFNAADASRFLHLTLLERRPGDRSVHPLLRNTNAGKKAVEKLGRGMFARMVRDFDRFVAACDAMKNVIIDRGLDSRFADTYGTTMAASWVLLNDEFLTEEKAAEWLDKHDTSEAVYRTQTTNDAQDMFDHMLNKAVNVQGIRMSISELLVRSFDHKHDAYKNALKSYGLVLQKDETHGHVLLINTKSNPELTALFDGSQYANARVEDMFSRINGAYKMEKAVRFGAQVCKPLCVPMTGLEVVKSMSATAEESLNFGI